MYFTPILLFATAISALPAISRRDTAETLANLQAIDASTRSLTTTVQNWDGSALGALGINGATVDLEVPSPNTINPKAPLPLTPPSEPNQRRQRRRPGRDNCLLRRQPDHHHLHHRHARAGHQGLAQRPGRQEVAVCCHRPDFPRPDPAQDPAERHEYLQRVATEDCKCGPEEQCGGGGGDH